MKYFRLDDVLDMSQIQIDGLDIDTIVDIVVVKDGKHFEIDSSSFGEKPFYVVTDKGEQLSLQLTVDSDFYKRLEKAVEHKALMMAVETDPDDERWVGVSDDD